MFQSGPILVPNVTTFCSSNAFISLFYWGKSVVSATRWCWSEWLYISFCTWWDVLEDWHHIVHILTCWDKWRHCLIDWPPRLQLQRPTPPDRIDLSPRLSAASVVVLRNCQARRRVLTSCLYQRPCRLIFSAEWHWGMLSQRSSLTDIDTGRMKSKDLGLIASSTSRKLSWKKVRLCPTVF